jgi:cell division protein ZapD
MALEDKNSEHIVFELPLNDHTRICLRLEQLFYQVKHNIDSPTETGSYLALTALLKILDVTDRPDLKSKVTQALTQHFTQLNQLENSTKVNQVRLKNLLEDLNRYITCLHANRARIGDTLRTNEFLNQIRLQLGSPGGICPYKTPAYLFWLKKPSFERVKDLKGWVAELQELSSMIHLLLKLTRDSAISQKVSAEKGFYQQNLDSNLPCQLIRVLMPLQAGLYPEISAGKHRLTIRFLTPNFHETGRSTQTQANVVFELSCCKS